MKNLAKIAITRKSMHSGFTHTRMIAVTEEQLKAYQKGELIQKAMLNVSKEDREFIHTGITPEEWKEMFKNEEM